MDAVFATPVSITAMVGVIFLIQLQFEVCVLMWLFLLFFLAPFLQEVDGRATSKSLE